MIVKDQICCSGAPNRPNEDISGTSIPHNIVWVIDGATGLTKTPLIAKKDTDAKWFSNTANELIYKVLEENIVDNKYAKSYITQVLSTVLTRMITKFEKNKFRTPQGNFEEPCASMSIIYAPEGDDNIHCFVLGDCPIIIENNNNIEIITGDEIHAKLDEISCEQAKSYLTKGVPFIEMREAIKDTLHKHRNMMNTDNGYWIFSLTLKCLEHIRYYKFPRNNNTKALIMSDGFYALVDKYGRYTDKALIDKAKAGLAPLYDELRSIELEEDPLCQKYIRLKQSDDATAILVSI